MSDTHAIIDIGSNTVRLVVYDGLCRAPAVLLNEKVTAKLGKDVAKSGVLGEKPMKVALSALARYAVLLDVMSVGNVEVAATAAVRDAGNGGEFLDAVRRLGLEPRLLSGEEEAITSAMGVAAAFPGARGVAADLGGGSLELTELAGDVCEHGISLPFGTLRLPDLLAEHGTGFSRVVRDSLRAARWSTGTGQSLYLVGGSWRALARYAMHHRGWPLDDPHGYELDGGEAVELCREVMRDKSIAGLPRVSALRLATLPDAAALLRALVGQLHPLKLVFSSWGLREGLLYRKLDRATRSEDPLIASVGGFARAFGVTPSDAEMISDWTATMVPECDPAEERLRRAATMLALAAMQIEPNLRTEEAMSWALRKRWIGIDASGRAMLAAAMLANNGITAVPDELLRLASADELRRAVGWGLAVRLARRLTGGAAAAISGTSLNMADGRLTISLREPLHALYSNMVGKDHRLLAHWVELEPAVELLPGRTLAGVATAHRG